MCYTVGLVPTSSTKCIAREHGPFGPYQIWPNAHPRQIGAWAPYPLMQGLPNWFHRIALATQPSGIDKGEAMSRDNRVSGEFVEEMRQAIWSTKEAGKSN